MDVLAHFDLHLIYLLVFSIALSLGTGAALLCCILSFGSVRDGYISNDEFRIIRTSKSVTWLAFILYAFSGIGLFTLSYEAMIGLGIFWASQVVILILFAGMLFSWWYLLPQLKQLTGSGEMPDADARSRLFSLVIIGEVIVFVSWLFLVVHHALYRVPFEFSQFLALYILVLLLGFSVSALAARHARYHSAFILRRVIPVVATLLIGLIFASVFIENGAPQSQEETGAANEITDAGFPLYSPKEIAEHNTVEDCWVIIDADVYDASNAAAKYPDIYSCGEDVTEAYRTVVPEGVSERMQGYQVGGVGYTVDEVASNHHKDSCWLIIDDLVFDATAESKLHPAAFSCGGDASANYHKNHGDEISDRMMQYHVGYVLGSAIEGGRTENVTHAVIEPYKEIYVADGSWQPDDLMAIVEKDVEKLLFIDGSTHTEIGRIHDVGYQPHTSVFSHDGQFMYIIARDGWLTKIDLTTLEPVKTVRAGINSRGTALTENGEYLAIGNYEPGNVVILDAATLEIRETIPTTGELAGEVVESRVGGLVEDGNRFIAALKDLNSVWIIDTADDRIEVTEQYWDIGANQTPLHDAYLTPDGRFYIVASMGSHTVWVLDTDTWEPIGEIETGETPHTGPGATWGNYTYVPALGEGLITAIDITTWTPAAYIETGGPGLFVRSYGEDPEYPYVWTETAFGDKQDEIYVIDARINEIVQTLIPVAGESSWHPEFTNDGSYVYVVSQSGNEVTVYDAHTFEVVKRFDSETPSAVSNVGNRIEEKGL